MGKNLYIGNLAYGATEDQLRDLFGAIGEVAGVNIIQDRETGRPRGFAFVEMAAEQEAARAVEMLNGQSFMERVLIVSEARPRREGGGGQERRHSPPRV